MFRHLIAFALFGCCLASKSASQLNTDSISPPVLSTPDLTLIQHLGLREALQGLFSMDEIDCVVKSRRALVNEFDVLKIDEIIAQGVDDYTVRIVAARDKYSVQCRADSTNKNAGRDCFWDGVAYSVYRKDSQSLTILPPALRDTPFFLQSLQPLLELNHPGVARVSALFTEKATFKAITSDGLWLELDISEPEVGHLHLKFRKFTGELVLSELDYQSASNAQRVYIRHHFRDVTSVSAKEYVESFHRSDKYNQFDQTKILDVYYLDVIRVGGIPDDDEVFSPFIGKWLAVTDSRLGEPVIYETDAGRVSLEKLKEFKQNPGSLEEFQSKARGGISAE